MSAPIPVPGAQDGRTFDRIAVTGLEVTAHHGVFDFERRDGQRFGCDVVLHLDTRAAAGSDDLAHTVHYGVVTEQVVAALGDPPVDLIETLAERIARTVLTHDPVRAVDVTVHKPQAPVGVPVSDVTLSIRRLGRLLASPTGPGGTPRRSSVVLALGANLGDARGALRGAVHALATHPQVQVTAVSPLARTAPVLAPGQDPQPDYLNAVVLATTTLSPLQLLALAQQVEAGADRRRLEHWGARTLDVDVVDIDALRVDDATLTLPHPRAHERDFVLRPWLWADPQATVPLDGGSTPVEDLVGDGDVERVGSWTGTPSEGDWVAEAVGSWNRDPAAEEASCNAPE